MNLRSTASAWFLTAVMANGGFSAFEILQPDVYQQDHAKYRATLRANEKNPSFVDVIVPYVDDGLGYWLVIARDQLPDRKLEFRSFIWGQPIPDEILSVSRLAEAPLLWDGPPKGSGNIEFTVHKDLLNRAYVYHDFDSRVLDGGYYYTYDLSKHEIEPDGADQPTTSPERKPEVKGEPQPETKPATR